MTLFAIYQRPADEQALPLAVAEKFSWTACLLPPVFALRHGMWLEFLVYGVKLVAIIALSFWMGAAAGLGLYVILAIWIGFAAPTLLGNKHKRQGELTRAHIFAPDPDSAKLIWMERP